MSNIYLKNLRSQNFDFLGLKNLSDQANIIFERNYVLKSKNPWILLSKNINANKNEAESKMENPTHSFREMNLVL